MISRSVSTKIPDISFIRQNVVYLENLIDFPMRIGILIVFLWGVDAYIPRPLQKQRVAAVLSGTIIPNYHDRDTKSTTKALRHKRKR